MAAANLTTEIQGFMEPWELDWLRQTAARFETIVEIGTWKGRSAAALAEVGAMVFTVDHFQGSPSERDGAHAEAAETDIRALAEKNLDGFPNVTILAHSSLEASRLFADNSIDMVFLDGDHDFEAVLVDLVAWRPKCRHLICGHDKDWDGVYRALATYGLPYQPGPGTIWHTELHSG